MLFLGLVTTASFASEPFSAGFDVSRNGKALGTMEMSLTETTPGNLEFVSRSEGTEGMAGLLAATIEERSWLRRSEFGFATIRYRYVQKMVGRKRERALDITDDGKIVESERDDQWNYRASGDVLDRHAAVLGVAKKLAAGASKGSVLSIDVAMRGEVEAWRFLVVGHETVQTSYGEVDAVRVERIRANANRHTVSWHSPRHSFMPVKVEQTEPDGELLTTVLKRFASVSQ